MAGIELRGGGKEAKVGGGRNTTLGLCRSHYDRTRNEWKH